MNIRVFSIISLCFLCSCQNWSVPNDLYSYPIPSYNNYYTPPPVQYYPANPNQPRGGAMPYYDNDSSYRPPYGGYPSRPVRPPSYPPQNYGQPPRPNYQNPYQNYQNYPSDNDSLYYYNYTPKSNSVIDNYDVSR